MKRNGRIGIMASLLAALMLASASCGGAEETDAVTNLKEKGPAVSLLGGEDVRLGVEPEGTDLSSVFTGTDQGIFKTYGQTKEENQP